MKKAIFTAIILLFVISLANAQIVSKRDMKTSPFDSSTLIVTLNIQPNGLEKYDVAELYPVDWQLTSWNVVGNSTPVLFEQQTATYKEKPMVLFHWSFNDSSNTVLTYNVKAPQNASGEAQVVSIIVYPGGFTPNTYLVLLGKGGSIEQTVPIQPVTSYKEFGNIIVIAMLTILIIVLLYYIWLIKKEGKKEIPEAPKPQKQISEAPQKQYYFEKSVPKNIYKKAIKELESVEKGLKKKKYS